MHGYLLELDELRAMEPELTGELVGASFFPRDLQCAPRAIARALAGGLPRVHTGVEVHAVDGRARPRDGPAHERGPLTATRP